MAGSCGDICGVLCASFLITGTTFVLVATFPIAQIAIGAVYMDECPVSPSIPLFLIVSGAGGLVLTFVNACGRYAAQSSEGRGLAWLCTNGILSLFLLIWFIFGSYHVYSINPPNYNKNATVPKYVTQRSHIPDFSEHDTKFNFSSHPLPNLSNNNQTWTMNHDRTLINLIQRMAFTAVSNETVTGKPEPIRPIAVRPYCNRTMYLFAFWSITLVYILLGIGLFMLCCFYGCFKLSNVLTFCFMNAQDVTE